MSDLQQKRVPTQDTNLGLPNRRWQNNTLAGAITLTLLAGSVMPTIGFSEPATNNGSAQEVNYTDLSNWQQQGPIKNGNWNVSTDTKFVEQTINGNPTFYISPNNFINGLISGSFEVYNAAGDDDYIGFVLGYQSPISALGDNDSDGTFLLFDWKRGEQYVKEFDATGKAGYSLVQISNLSGFNTHCFWGHQDNPPSCNVLATDYGNGWQGNTKYWFELNYRTDRIIIKVGDNPSNLSTIFDIEGSFEPGRFGFYNFSQPNVRYGEYTYEGDPPSTENDAYDVDEGTTLSVLVAEGVLANDSAATLNGLTAEVGDGTSNGSLSLNSDGSFTYTPNTDFHGSDSFTYRIFDGSQYSDYATVNITVNPLSDLTVSQLQFDPESVSFSVRIGNDGIALSPETLVSFYNGDPKNGGKFIGSKEVARIEPGAYQDVVYEALPDTPNKDDMLKMLKDLPNNAALQAQLKILIGNDVVEGLMSLAKGDELDVYVFVDADEQIHEYDETNNIVSETISLASCRAFGKVLDKHGNPIEGATTQVGDKTALTDATGYWEITGLSENNDYTLTISKEGYSFESQDFQVGDNQQQCKNVDLGNSKGASLLTVKVVPDSWEPVKLDDNAAYTITVTNEGDATATDVVLDYMLPEGANLVSIETLDGGSCDTDTINCTLPDLTPSATANVKVVISHTQPGKLVSTAKAGSNEYPFGFKKIWKEVKPYLSVSISDSPDPVQMQNIVHYTVGVDLSHYSPSAATGVELVTTLPSGVELKSVNTDYGMCDTSTLPTMTCSITDLSLEGTDSVSHVTVNLDVELKDAGLLMLTTEAKITANEHSVHTDTERTKIFIPEDVKVDIAFVIDVTGSMQEEINGVIKAIKDFIAAIDPNDAPLVALVVFTDDVKIKAFTSDLDVLLKAVENLQAAGGGKCPEASAEALLIAIPHTKQDGNILFATDASPYENADIDGITEQLLKKGIRFNAMITGDCTQPDSWNELSSAE